MASRANQPLEEADRNWSIRECSRMIVQHNKTFLCAAVLAGWARLGRPQWLRVGNGSDTSVRPLGVAFAAVYSTHAAGVPGVVRGGGTRTSRERVGSTDTKFAWGTTRRRPATVTGLATPADEPRTAVAGACKSLVPTAAFLARLAPFHSKITLAETLFGCIFIKDCFSQCPPFGTSTFAPIVTLFLAHAPDKFAAFVRVALLPIQ